MVDAIMNRVEILRVVGYRTVSVQRTQINIVFQ